MQQTLPIGELSLQAGHSEHQSLLSMLDFRRRYLTERKLLGLGVSLFADMEEDELEVLPISPISPHFKSRRFCFFDMED